MCIRDSYSIEINERRIQTQKYDKKHWNVSLYSERRRVACRDKALLFMHIPGADEQELATPILSLCHGIFTD